MEFTILRAPRELFKSSNPEARTAQVVNTSSLGVDGTVPVESVVWSDGEMATIFYTATGQKITVEDKSGKHGIFRNKRGLLYPVKGFSDDEIGFALCAVKQTLMATMVFLDWPILIGTLLLSKKRKIALLESYFWWFIRPFAWLLTPYFWKDEYYGAFSTELRKWIYVFLTEIGISSQMAAAFAEIFAFIFDCDDSYRYLAEDVFSETNAKLLTNNPRKEIQRLLAIILERNFSNPPDKFTKIAKAGAWLSHIPFIKRAFIKATNSITFENLQYDKADRYHTLYRSGYNFQGRTSEDRYKELIDLHGGTLPDAMRV